MKILLTSACGLAACDEGPPTVPFSEVRTEILVPSCTSSTCHGGGAGALWMTAETAYDALVEVRARQRRARCSWSRATPTGATS